MSDLIDREKLLEERPEWLNAKHTANAEYNRGWNDCNGHWLKIVKQQPTAYDADKVLKQLEDLKKEYQYKVFGDLNSYTEYREAWADCCDRAIQLVKRSGTDETD